MFIEFFNIFKLIKIKLNSYMTSNSDNTNFLTNTSEEKLKKVIYDLKKCRTYKYLQVTFHKITICKKLF